jgi:hypothetical protein
MQTERTRFDVKVWKLGAAEGMWIHRLSFLDRIFNRNVKHEARNDSNGKGSHWRKYKGRRRQPKSPGFTFLHALARNWAWDAVVHRCETHPSEASDIYVDSDGDNSLHWVSFGRPPFAVVNGLLSICPDLVKRKNARGLTPLHGEFNVTNVAFFTYFLHLTLFVKWLACIERLPRLSLSW